MKFFHLVNTADTWRQELMGLAQQVQSSLGPTQPSRSNQLRSQRGSSSAISSLQENNEQYISKRLLNRRPVTRYAPSYTIRSKLAINENEEETSNGSKTEDAGIWVILSLIDFLGSYISSFSYFQSSVTFYKWIILLMHKNGW